MMVVEAVTCCVWENTAFATRRKKIIPYVEFHQHISKTAMCLAEVSIEVSYLYIYILHIFIYIYNIHIYINIYIYTCIYILYYTVFSSKDFCDKVE